MDEPLLFTGCKFIYSVGDKKDWTIAILKFQQMSIAQDKEFFSIGKSIK